MSIDSVLGDILLSDEHISKAEFDSIADEVIRQARRVANANSDDGEALSKDNSGRNSHSVAGIQFITIDTDDFEL